MFSDAGTHGPRRNVGYALVASLGENGNTPFTMSAESVAVKRAKPRYGARVGVEARAFSVRLSGL